jgi:copper chaperone
MLRLKVTGMTCGHCVRAVTEAVESVAPGTQVDISLETGALGIAGEADAGRVIAAIEDAGYAAEPLAG